MYLASSIYSRHETYNFSGYVEATYDYTTYLPSTFYDFTTEFKYKKHSSFTCYAKFTLICIQLVHNYKNVNIKVI